jgi:glycosyltransferase involved in cell wall biosynthesis
MTSVDSGAMNARNAIRAVPAAADREKPRVLVLSRNYPNSAFPTLGMWAEGVSRLTSRFARVKVISPVPYCPPLPGLPENFARFRRVERHRWDGDIEIFYPRMVIPPGSMLHGAEHWPYRLRVAPVADRLRREFPFDLIHAHFTYPDGWVAAKLGERYGVPVIITEQAAWRPWMDNFPRVCRHALWAASHSAFHIAISRAHRETITHFTGETPRLQLIPDAVDGEVFTLPPEGHRRISNQLLIVGAIRHVKGADILAHAMRRLVDRGHDVKLVHVGESFYGGWRRDFEEFQALVDRLGLKPRVEYTGKKSTAELVGYLQDSSLLVLPSRRESLGLVLVEALACGTPVVATRCGGPEDIVTNDVGVLVPPEDPDALASGIELALARREVFDPGRLRSHALERFGFDAVAERLAALYREALSRGRQRSNE